MLAKKRPGLIIHSYSCIKAMAKWSLRIEMQAMDIEEHRQICREVYSAGQIFDCSDSVIL